jgi:hypothetical protein
MRVVSRFFALLLAMLLVAQAASAVRECGAAMAGMGSHHGMDAPHHSGTPAPSDHHPSCQPAVCATMAACTSIALAEPGQAPAPRIDQLPLQPVSQTAVLPSGLRPPDPPPPRA